MNNDEAISGCLLISRNDLFGSRMLPFINALRIGHDYDLLVKIYWPSSGGTGTNIDEYSDVFSQAFIDAHFITHKEFQTLNKDSVALTQVKKKPIAEIVAMVSNGSVFALNNSQAAMSLAGEDIEKVLESYQLVLDRITFTPTVEQNIQKIRTITHGQNIVAYHVRHGDVTTRYRPKNKEWPHKFTPCEFFVQHFKSHGQEKGTKALLFGDFKPSLDWLGRQCPDFIKIGDIIDLTALGSLQRDFLELYAMSRAAKIIGPRHSGFSQLAASLGGVPFHDIMKDMNPLDYIVAYGNLYTRLSNDPQSFSSFGEIGQCLAHLIPYLIANNQADKARKLLESEINRGNNISFLFSLWAKTSLMENNHKNVLEIRKLSTQVVMDNTVAIADTEALAAQAAFHIGDTKEAIRLLSLAFFQSPYAPQVKIAFNLLDENGLLKDTSFYPLDRELMSAIAFGSANFLPVFFAWEWRFSLASTFQRPLTHAGAADQFLRQISNAFDAKKTFCPIAGQFQKFSKCHFDGHGESQRGIRSVVGGNRCCTRGRICSATPFAEFDYK